MSKQLLSVNVNGLDREIPVEPDTKLLTVLRDQLGLTGAKYGCGEGECGACTVLLDGKPVSSCITLAMEAAGRKITTIEGLASPDGTLHPVQEAFARGEAVQCGFCTPGMILSAKALLDQNPNPTDEQIRRALAGNLCRCTGYTGIVAAIKQAAAVIRGETTFDPLPDYGANLVGKPIERLGVRDRVQGKTLYAADLRPPGMLHAAILRSPLPKAKIKKIDVTKARKLKGVRAVITGADLPDKRWGLIFSDEVLLARDQVRYVGERVVAVAAETRQIAEKALALVKVDYKPLRPVLDMEQARKPNAPRVHEDSQTFAPGYFDASADPPKDNVTSSFVFTAGDADAAFAQADVVLEEEYRTAPQHQGHIETHVAVAQAGQGGRVTIHTSTQTPFIVRHAVATYLDLPMAKVRVVWMETGGAFGNKIPVFVEPIAAALALACGRPVQLHYSRQDELVDSRPRAATITRIKTGARRDGALLARKVEFLLDNGAYTDVGWGTAAACQAGVGPYRIPNTCLEGHSIYTNKFNTGPFRAPGYPQITFAVESHTDALAAKLGIDPIELRRMNALRTGDKTTTGTTIRHDVFYRCLNAVAERIDADPARDHEGWGLACGQWPTGGCPCGALLKINEDGSVAVTVGSSDLSGSATSIAQVAAQELCIGLDKLSVAIGDTDTAPFPAPSGGSQATYNMTNVVRKGAQQLVAQIKEIASEHLDEPPEALDVADGRAFVRDDPAAAISFAELSAARPLGVSASTETIPSTHAFCVNGIKVRIDPATGQVTVLRAVSAIDCGKAINPASVRGQASGGLAQSLGLALWEEIVQDPTDGRVLTQGFTDYHMPTAADVPPVETIIIEGDPSTSLGHGLKGLGEPVHVPGAAATANAVAAATGHRHHRLPITPEQILKIYEANND
ncbi:MAG: molybdopterin-dependent oxidoreductase [Phycisphaerae bacterium]|nr:molybdopterin-dependent oxidoreductase [Phycisphaerae bacterium]